MASSRSSAFLPEAMRRLLLHQDGLAVSAAAATLDAVGLLEPLVLGQSDVEQLRATTSPACVAACTRALANAGWLSLPPNWPYDGKIEPRTSATDTMLPLGAAVETHRLLRTALHTADWTSAEEVGDRVAGILEPAGRIRSATCARLAAGEADRLARYLEGPIATVVLPRHPWLAGHAGPGTALGRTTAFLELTDDAGSTSLGAAMASFRPMYGLAGSYAKALLDLPEWVRSGTTVRPSAVNGVLQRELNVIASGSAHRGYFQAAANSVRAVFDAQPVAGQPAGIVDIGCGDGSWLRALADLVVNRTARGRELDRHPLVLIGVDADRRALAVARSRDIGLPVAYLDGDVADPDAISRTIESAVAVPADNLLFVRAFVDHNREISARPSAPRTGPDDTGMIYQDESGRLLPEPVVIEDWSRHLRRWQATCRRHGMLILEAHALTSREVLEKQGVGHSLAFEFYHSLSGQSPIGWRALQAVLASSGFRHAAEPIGFPRGSATAVSLQHLVATG